MTESLASVVDRFLAHRRALGRKYHSEEAELRLLVRFAYGAESTGWTSSPRSCWMSSWPLGRGRVRVASTTSSASSTGCWSGWSCRSCWSHHRYGRAGGG